MKIGQVAAGCLCGVVLGGELAHCMHFYHEPGQTGLPVYEKVEYAENLKHIHLSEPEFYPKIRMTTLTADGTTFSDLSGFADRFSTNDTWAVLEGPSE